MRISQVEDGLDDLNLKFDFLVDTMNVFQSNINNMINWFYMVLGIMVAILIIALYFLVKTAVLTGVDKAIKSSNTIMKEELEKTKREFSESSEGFITPTLIMGWYHNSEEVVRYSKDYFGNVHIEGLIENGVYSEGTQIFSFADGYRPSSKMTFGVTTINLNNQIEQGLISINEDGSVIIIKGSNKIILNGINFLAKSKER